jgi:SOS-response transcriptional repressor LexA
LSLKLNQDAKNIGARFRSARSLVPDLNRKSFCERHGINRYTMQSWENGLHVSKGKNVEKFIDALAREGVYCTAEWLIDGKGEPAKPMFGHDVKSTTELLSQSQEIKGINAQTNIDRVIKGLIEAHDAIGDELITLCIQDNAMAPKFLVGDMVLAKNVFDNKLALHQKYCVIKLSQERMIARKVLVTKEGFLIMALDDQMPTFFLNLDSKVYKIVWHLIAQ